MAAISHRCHALSLCMILLLAVSRLQQSATYDFLFLRFSVALNIESVG